MAVSFVLPCLNESETLGRCLAQIQGAAARLSLTSEIVVADNGSTDGSPAIAAAAGARVVHVAERGYGAALIGGCQAARGQMIVMGDADASYDFYDSLPMIARLQAGDDLVVGSRFRGRIEPGAMPWKNQYIGNPMLTGILNLFYRSGLSDAHCGLRAFTRTAFERMALRSAGMEFASEMVVKAALLDLRRSEVPITYRPDGRQRAPHLRPWRDGWRHLRFLLLYSPRWLYLRPGALLLLLGLLLNTALVLLPSDQFVSLGPLFFGTHWMIPATFFAGVGAQMLLLGVVTEIYSTQRGLYPAATWQQRLGSLFQLEWGLLLGLLLLLCGGIIEAVILWRWLASGFGPLDSVRPAIYGLMWLLLGAQLGVHSFFLSLLIDDPTEGDRSVTSQSGRESA